MNALRHWWMQRNERERRMLLVMAVAIGAFVYWLGLLRPLEQARLHAEQRYLDAARAHLESGAAVAELDAAGMRGNSGLAQDLAANARAAGLDDVRKEGEAGGPVAIVIDRASPQTLFAWLDALRQQHGIVPTTVHLEARDGAVQARLEFPAGSGAAP